jgi:hypothetical protein
MANAPTSPKNSLNWSSPAPSGSTWNNQSSELSSSAMYPSKLVAV